MSERPRKELSALLRECRVATLAVMVNDRPYASLVPFAMTQDLGAALIHTSSLARHSEGLTAGAAFSLLIHETDSPPHSNPAQLARVSLEGRVSPIERNDAGYAEARERYLAKFPKSQITFDLADFTLHALEIAHCRFVAGFAQTYNLTAAELKDLA
jgi:putative heme iron utilization protein